MEIGRRMGGPVSRRFVLTVQAADHRTPQTAIRVADWTYHLESHRPTPLSMWYPQKLYASDNIVHFIRDNGGVLWLYDDDFEFADSLPERWD
jgi:hypothetical protein